MPAKSMIDLRSAHKPLCRVSKPTPKDRRAVDLRSLVDDCAALSDDEFGAYVRMVRWAVFDPNGVAFGPQPGVKSCIGTDRRRWDRLVSRLSAVGLVEVVAGGARPAHASVVSTPRSEVPWRIRERMMMSGKGCARCGAQSDLTIDHIVPLAKGGTNDERNLQILCAPCNRRKGVS